MAKIKVGCEYKNEFQSICNLFKRGFLSDKVNIKRVTDTEIVTAANTFEYCDWEHGVGGGDDTENELRFDRSGASWFAGLRGAQFDSSSSDWEQLISDVAADYHKYYSLIEFRQNIDARLATIGGSLATVTNRFNNEFLKRVFDTPFSVSERFSIAPENFYAVSMRLEINGGAESEPLLGKIYFRKSHDGKYIPIRCGEAEGIDNYIRGAVPDESSSGSDGELVDGQLVSDVLGQLDSLFECGDCADYIMFNGEFLPKIDKMLKLLATSDEKELECTHVTVLGISHVEWQNLAYSVTMGGKQVMRLVIGLNNTISLYCTNCSSTGVLLIDNNEVLFPYGELGDDERYKLDYDERDLGLNDAAVQYIRSSSLLSRHLMAVSCPDNPRNNGCVRTVCAQQTIEYSDESGKVVCKCKGCPYPEVVYHDIFSSVAESGKLTSALSLDEQAFELTENSTKTCKCCGRTYSDRNGRGGMCRLCSSSEYTDAGHKLYKKYSKMLGLGIRLRHMFSKKYCTEDSNIIIFELGRNRYIFDKLSAREYGYVSSPKKVR